MVAFGRCLFGRLAGLRLTRSCRLRHHPDDGGREQDGGL